MHHLLKTTHGLDNLQTAICRRIFSQHFFHQYFCELLENSCSASKKKKKKMFQKFLESSQKTPVGSLILVKLQAFTEATTGGVCKRCLQNSQENTCVRDSILIKFAGLRL